MLEDVDYVWDVLTPFIRDDGLDYHGQMPREFGYRRNKFVTARRNGEVTFSKRFYTITRSPWLQEIHRQIVFKDIVDYYEALQVYDDL